MRPISEVIKSRPVTAREWCLGEAAKSAPVKVASATKRRTFGKRKA